MTQTWIACRWFLTMLIYKILQILASEELQACQPDLSTQEDYGTGHLGCGHIAHTGQSGELAQPAEV